MKFQIFLGDALETLKSMPANSVDSLVTDPPAGIGLMGLEWDKDKGGRKKWIAWLTQIMCECHRVLKPGAHGFVWALPRTSHWTGTALEDAGFLVKDVMTHVFGSGFPKSIAIDKAIDRAKYTNTQDLFRVAAWIRERRNQLGLTNKQLDEIAGVKGGACHWTAQLPQGQPHIPTKERWEKLEKILGPAPDWMVPLIKPTNDFFKESESNAQSKWVGWGTALKPASEHWILIQKPISEHNLAANILKHGTGAINIDGARIPINGKIPSTTNLDFKDGGFLWDARTRSQRSIYHQHPAGRFPANFVLTKSDDSQCPAHLLNDQSEREIEVASYFQSFKLEPPFLYCKKPDKRDRGETNLHPTVKPTKLMRYLCKMITPPDKVVLDPFMGSGSTGVSALIEKFKFIGIERDPNYFEISKKRLEGAMP